MHRRTFLKTVAGLFVAATAPDIFIPSTRTIIDMNPQGLPVGSLFPQLAKAMFQSMDYPTGGRLIWTEPLSSSLAVDFGNVPVFLWQGESLPHSPQRFTDDDVLKYLKTLQAVVGEGTFVTSWLPSTEEQMDGPFARMAARRREQI